MRYDYLEALPIPANFFVRAQGFFTNIEFSFYVRLVAGMCRTAGFLPYDMSAVRRIAGMSKLYQASSLIEKLIEVTELELVDYGNIPEKFRALLGKNAAFFSANPRIIFHPAVFALATAEVQKHERMARIGQIGNAPARQVEVPDSSDVEREKKRSKRKEKEILLKHVPDSGEGAAVSEEQNGTAEIEAVAADSLPVSECAVSQKREAEEQEASCETAAVCSEPRQMTLTGMQEQKLFDAREFRELWNRWAAHFDVPQFNKLTEKRRRKLRNRMESFKRQGAMRRQFWIDLLSAVAETGNGFYIGRNDGYHHCGTPWTVTVDWLLKEDEHIERFLNALR